MAVGKNKLLRFARLYFGGYDLSGDARTFDTLDNTFAPVDTTGISDEVENALSDRRRVVGVKGFQTLLNDAAAGAYTILKNAPQNLIVSVLLGGGDVPAAGDLAYLLPAVQMGDETEFSQKIGALKTDFLLDASQMSSLVDNPWGVVLMPKTALTITTNGSAVDGGAASLNGARANLHVFVSSGGTWAFTIEHSTTGVGAWSTIMTFTITASGIAAEMKTAAGTINQFTRLVSTRTSGTCTVAASIARN